MAGTQKAKDKYLKEKVETMLIRVPKGQKAVIQERAESLDKSLNRYIVDLISADMGVALQPSEKPAPAPKAKQPAAKKPAAQSASAPAASKQSAVIPAPIPAAAKQPVSKPQPDHLMPIAAHHDNPYDEEELEKLRKDIEEL